MNAPVHHSDARERLALVKSRLTVSEVAGLLGLKVRALPAHGPRIPHEADCIYCHTDYGLALRLDDQGFRCQRCGSTGDIVNLVRDKMGLGFIAALKELEKFADMGRQKPDRKTGDLFGGGGKAAGKGA